MTLRYLLISRIETFLVDIYVMSPNKYHGQLDLSKPEVMKMRIQPTFRKSIHLDYKIALNKHSHHQSHSQKYRFGAHNYTRKLKHSPQYVLQK